MASPTIDETYNDLVAINKIVTSSLYELGKVRGKNNLLTEEDLRQLVLSTSKAILDRLPCLQFENDAIEEMDSKYGHMLARLEEDPDALQCQDQADKGLCGECIEPCDVRDGKGAQQ